MDSQKEIKLLDLQNITTILFIGSLIISLYITTEDKKQRIYPNESHKDMSSISIFNRFFVLCLSLSYLYISYETRKIAKNKGEKTDLLNLQVIASEISTLSTIIVLYVVIKSVGENYSIISGIENPNL